MINDADRKAMMLAEKWWKEGKLSYNWDPEEDVKFLANVIRDASEKEMDCSCTLCVCENESQYQGCGAKKCDPCKKARGEG